MNREGRNRITPSAINARAFNLVTGSRGAPPKQVTGQMLTGFHATDGLTVGVFNSSVEKHVEKALAQIEFPDEYARFSSLHHLCAIEVLPHESPPGSGAANRKIFPRELHFGQNGCKAETSGS